MEESGEYIHGTAPSEQRRLALLNELLNPGSLARMALRSGERVLDVGTGLGDMARAMARAVGPEGVVVGVERHEEQINEALRRGAKAGEERLVEFRPGSAMNLPLSDGEWGSFDVVHTRFLLEHLPRPQVVVDGMVRAARPGGRVILEDDDHHFLTLWPEVASVTKVWQAYIEALSKLGNDPFIGRRLVVLLHTAGAAPARNDWNFFGSCAGQDSFGGFVTNLAGVIESARKSLTDLTVVTGKDIDRALSDLDAWGKRADAALWYCTFWAEGHKPQPSNESRG